jgi:deazaflavin-dependent oxidoreductase (nitroreductase family)
MTRFVRQRFLWLPDRTLNRATSRLARAGRGPFSLVRHVGRNSGRTYETPVILARVPEGFIAELTYGDRVNWYRNIVAAGGCVVLHRRREYRVTAIEPCRAEYGRSAFPAPARVILKAARPDEFRLLRVGGVLANSTNLVALRNAGSGGSRPRTGRRPAAAAHRSA